MKKLLSATLAFLFILGSVTFTPVTAPAEALNQSAYDLIEEAVENLDDTVNISSCMVVYDQVHSSSPELSEILERLRNNRPDFFYFSYSVNFSVMSSDGGHTYYITNITLFYDMNKDDIPAAINYVNGKIDGIIDDIAYINELTQLQQALSVHDYLAVNFNYDYSLDNADVYSMLSEKVGVCQAFTGLYMMILKKLGITVSWSSSSDMNHIWNLVKLDGNWYHVDTTWDDSSTTGRVYHYYFLQSDAAWADPLKEGIGNHYNWTDDYTCSDTAYDAYYWTNVISPIIFYDSNECYFIRYTGTSTIGMLMKHTDNSDSEMAHINDRWFVYESTASYYPGCYSGLDAYGKYLYYNTPDTIYRFDTENNSSESIFHSDALDGSIYGINVTPSAEGCIIQYEVAKSPNDTDGQIYFTTDNPECAFGHVYGDWEITTEPTETTAGVRTRTCSVCGGTEEEAVPLLSTENGYVYSVDTQPTGSTDGLAKWVHTIYGTFYTVIPKLNIPLATTLEGALSESLVFYDDYVRGFTVGTKIINYYTEDYNIIVYASDGTTVVTGNNLATGYIIKLYDENDICLDAVTVVIAGDTSGDGIINVLDYITIRLHILEISPITGAKLGAGDINNDGYVKVLDYIILRLYLLGLANLN